MLGRPDGEGAKRPAGPAGWALGGGAPLHADPGPPPQEQPRPHRRPWRRQDGDRRRPRAVRRRRPRAAAPEGRARALARAGAAGGGHQVPRRVRAAPARGHRGGHQVGRHHPLHRRAAHARRSRCGRGRHRRGQLAQAGARARRAAVHRRDDGGRVPPLHREGCRARAPLPARHRSRADHTGDGRHPLDALEAVRRAPQRDVRPRGAGGGGEAGGAVPARPLPARQGHRPHGRGRRHRPDCELRSERRAERRQEVRRRSLRPRWRRRRRRAAHGGRGGGGGGGVVVDGDPARQAHRRRVRRHARLRGRASREGHRPVGRRLGHLARAAPRTRGPALAAPAGGVDDLLRPDRRRQDRARQGRRRDVLWAGEGDGTPRHV
mmetsp:Transcript_892/g.2438  ORF Transcript_892/g.2438 Transcript_892/m.2438 type:complete len:378 (-) Transcript_892:1600-2733(-)